MSRIKILAIITQDYRIANSYAKERGLLATGWRQIADLGDALEFEFDNYIYLDGPKDLIDIVSSRTRKL